MTVGVAPPSQLRRPKIEPGATSTLLYPQRQRCRACRRYFGPLVVLRLFCSYECAGLPMPATDEIEKAPRQCKTRFGGRLRWKVRHATEEEAVAAAQTEGHAAPKRAYLCDYCDHWHIGTDWKGIYS